METLTVCIGMPTDPASGDGLKDQVRAYWNRQSCDTQVASGAKFSRDYFEEIEAFRYFDQPYIHAFAQFTRYRGKRVLEVGFGAGTDFIQWLRAGAVVSGIDLTQEALDNVQHRIQAYDLPAPERLQVGDAENLPFASDQFDLGYSFGVLHHSPDTPKAVAELVRVVRPGGEIKIMLYNRRSVWAVNQWVKHALLKGRPWKSVAWALWHFNESVGTKAYTRGELAEWLGGLPVDQLHVHTEITSADYLSASAWPPLNLLYRLALRLGGQRFGWHPSHYVARDESDHSPAPRPVERKFRYPLFTGNPFGFFHCIHARKRNPQHSTPNAQVEVGS